MPASGGQRIILLLVEQHYASLYRYAYRLCGSAADAEDLTQEAYCKAQAKLGQLRDGRRAKAWLFAILRNEYLHRLRDRKHELGLSLDEVGDFAEANHDPLPDVDPERLQQALAGLPEAFRTPIILYYFEDFTYRDIAEQMDLPIGTVMSRLSRAKACLRQKLQPAATACSGDRGQNDGL